MVIASILWVGIFGAELQNAFGGWIDYDKLHCNESTTVQPELGRYIDESFYNAAT